MAKTCGIEWSERHHDVAIVDDQARVVGRARLGDHAAGFTQLLELLSEHGDGEDCPIKIAIESHKGLFVAPLVAAGFTVFPINPRAVARYRERCGQAGGKSDPGDAALLATSCAPTGTCTGHCRSKASWFVRSRCARVSIRRQSEHGSRR